MPRSRRCVRCWIKDDLIIDAGNANYHDTNRRAEEALEVKGPRFMGIGVSGGEEGARFGPSIMGGGATGCLGPGWPYPGSDFSKA